MTSQADGLNASEQLVARLCYRSFLRLWTHPNPKGKNGKELCDCLIVCDRHVVIISVKDCAFRDTGDIVGWGRWKKKAIDKSISQIAGAQSWLATRNTFERADGRIVQLPPHDVRKYHRIAVALGANGEVPVAFGDTGKGFIHLCDERSLETMFTYLDTIVDFVKFLSETEALLASGIQIIFSGGGIQDLLALYLRWGESYSAPNNFDGALPNLLILESDLWTGLQSSENFWRMKKHHEVSYAWDRLIEFYTDDLLTDGFFDFQAQKVTDDQRALIEMAIQPRHHRTHLAKALIEYRANNESAARVVVGNGETAFVFFARESADKNFKIQELTLRCQIVRACCPGVTKVVGIGLDRANSPANRYSSELVFLDQPDLLDEQRALILTMQEELGYFKGANWDLLTRVQYDFAST